MTWFKQIFAKGHETPRSLREEMSEIIDRLAQHLSEQDAAEGWNARLKDKWLTWFKELNSQLLRGQTPEFLRDSGYMGTARAMDFDGVGDSQICRLAARIDVRITKGERYS